MDLRSVAGEVGSRVVLFASDLICVPRRVFAGLALVPADGGVVIMGPSVDSAVGGIAFRSERFGFRVITEGKLKDSHSGKIEIIPECVDFGSDHPEVFRQNRKGTKHLVCRIEKLSAWPRNPVTTDRSLFMGRNLPIGGKPPKVVDSNSIV
jgi:hypothetical protein